MVAGRYAGMTDIADMPTYAYIAPFPHMQFAQVCIQRGKAARVPDFDVPAVTAAIPGFNDFPASWKHRPACHRVRQDPLRHGVSFSFHRMHPYTETGRNGIPPPTFIQWIQNRIIGQYGNRQPAVSYERLSLPGRVDTVDDSTESGFISL